MEPAARSTRIQEGTAGPLQDRTPQPTDVLPGATQVLCREPLGLTAPSIQLLCKMYRVKRARRSGVCPEDRQMKPSVFFVPVFRVGDPACEPSPYPGRWLWVRITEKTCEMSPFIEAGIFKPLLRRVQSAHTTLENVLSWNQ